MQTTSQSTLDPDRSRDALRKLRAAAETEADSVAPGAVAVVGKDISFDVERKPLSSAKGDPNDQFGAARYAGQYSEHIGNGHGGPQ